MLKFKIGDKVYIISEWYDGSIQIIAGIIRDWTPSGYSLVGGCTIYKENNIFGSRDEAHEEFKKWLDSH